RNSATGNGGEALVSLPAAQPARRNSEAVDVAQGQPAHHRDQRPVVPAGLGTSRISRSAVKAFQREAAQVKLAASSKLPDPLYRATCGNGQSGRLRSTAPLVTRRATILSGAFFCSTHCSSVPTLSNTLGPSPPLQ